MARSVYALPSHSAVTIWHAPCQVISIRCNMLSRPLERDCVPATLGLEGSDAAVGAVQLRPRLYAMDADALPCSERLPGCR